MGGGFPLGQESAPGKHVGVRGRVSPLSTVASGMAGLGGLPMLAAGGRHRDPREPSTHTLALLVPSLLEIKQNKQNPEAHRL